MASNSDKQKEISHDVVILGGRYTIRSGYDAAFVDKTAQLVNDKMNEIIRDGGVIASDKVAILACMNLASEFLRTQEENQKVKGRIHKRLEKVLAQLDTCLGQEELSYLEDKSEEKKAEEYNLFAKEDSLPCS